MRFFLYAFTLLIFGFVTILNSQPVQFKVPIALTVGPFTDTLYVGVNGDGPGGTINDNTYGLDETGFGSLGSWAESSAPPADPDGNRKRFIDIPGRTEIAAGGYLYPYDFRGFSSSSQIDTFAIRIDGARVENDGVTVSWPNNLGNYGNSWKLYSRSGSVFTEVANMLISASYNFNATGATINFAIIKTGVSTTGAELDHIDIPSEYQLGQNYPNPFNPTTRISYLVKEAGHVRIIVYNMLGQEVSTLLNREMTAGRYSVDWNSTDSNGRTIGSGLYFYRMTAGNFVDTRKMLLIK